MPQKDSMKQKFFKKEHTSTMYVMLDTKKCEGCWKCLNVCTKHVIGRINLPWHKHALFINGNECIGCMQCVKSCETGAINRRTNKLRDCTMNKKRNQFIVNIGLFIFGIITMFSGMLIQVKYHIGNHGNITITNSVFGISYPSWSIIHKVSILLLSLMVIFHVHHHRKWYKVVITKKPHFKSRQILIMSLLFILVAITGLTPWFIDLQEGNEIQRKALIEIHDKLALILTVYLMLHIIKKIRYIAAFFDKKETHHIIHDHKSDVDS